MDKTEEVPYWDGLNGPLITSERAVVHQQHMSWCHLHMWRALNDTSVCSAPGVMLTVNGKKALNMVSSNFLGVAGDPKIQVDICKLPLGLVHLLRDFAMQAIGEGLERPLCLCVFLGLCLACLERYQGGCSSLPGPTWRASIESRPQMRRPRDRTQEADGSLGAPFQMACSCRVAKSDPM